MPYGTHTNAELIPTAPARLARLFSEEDWTLCRAAERYRCSPAPALAGPLDRE